MDFFPYARAWRQSHLATDSLPKPPDKKTIHLTKEEIEALEEDEIYYTNSLIY